MYKAVLYQGEELLGEVEIYPEEKEKIEVKEIRISQFSQASERCPPLAVLHTITATGISFKMESKSSLSQDSPLFDLHSSCFKEHKTAIMPLGGGEELHLVAMYSKNNDKQYPCFWGFNVASGLYDSCLVMLNLRCLGIVFDLDETLIVANTMRSFEDRIEALQRKINSEVDPQRISGMLAEVKRYQDDKIILKQYAENDQVVENGKVIKTQSEVVPALSDNHQTIIRPLIRLQEKNIILTRINPQIRDTSVLVRLRPAWDDLRSYLIARGRKRFEVYVCTMAERDYALEMWRLLDPDLNLINSKELLDRIVCVKSGSRKSLFNVFHDGLCHPKMALVIDDRLKVWDEKDQPRVHVVPAFAPYYAPQAEANNAIPVLCVARNVACNVRGGFFKEFDEGLLQKIPEISYEDDIKDIPSPPDVSNYLVSEDDGSASNGNKDPLSFDGMADAEVERRLKDATSAPSIVTTLDPRLPTALQFTVAPPSGSIAMQTTQGSMMPFSNVQFPPATSLVKPLGQVGAPETSLQSSPAREEGEVPESELDPDTRRRLLILQHGQDTRDHAPAEPPFPVRPPLQVAVPRAQSHSGWFPVEEEMSPRQVSRAVPKEFPLDAEPMHIEKHRPQHPSFFPKVESSVTSDRVVHENQRLSKEVFHRDDRLRLNHALSSYYSFSGEDIPLGRSSSSSRDVDFESGRGVSNAETPAGLEDCEMKGVTSLLKMRESVKVVEVQDGGESESFKKLETLGVEGMTSGVDGVSRVVDIGGGVSNKGVEERGHLGEEFVVKDNGGVLSENGQDPDGEIGIVEVPIEDMVVNNEMEEEEGVVDEGHEFSVGDFVWGKIRSHPWWPGQVYDPSDASDYAAKLKVKDRLLVAYFGDGTFAWCQPSQLKPFEENFEEMSRQSNSKTFVYAVHKAVDEISRLLELEMTCSCVTKENVDGLDRPLAMNAGIKDGVNVPEGGIGKLSNIMTEPVDLLGEVKQIAQNISFPSTIGLWVLKSRLAAFYRAKGGYPLPLFHELQPIPGLEDDLNYGAAGVSNTVEVPIQGPFAEEWLSSPISPKFGQTGQTTLQKCLGNLDDRLHQRRKQKSIAEIMEWNNDVTAKGKDGDVAEEETTTGKLATSSARKKRKGIDETDAHLGNEATSVTRTKRKARMLGSPLSTNSKVSSVKNDGIGGKEETKKSPSSRRSKKNVNVSIVNVSIENDGVGEAKGKIEKGSLSRERKKSKYLSPPFTSLIGVQKKKDIEAESCKVSNEAQLGEQVTTAAGHLAGPPPILKRSRDKLQKKISPELGLGHEPSNISNPQTPKQDLIPVIDPMKVKAPANQVLTQVRYAALNPTTENKSLEMMGNFMSILRSSVYRDGSNYKAYNKRQTGRKRKNIDTGPGSLGKDQNHSDHKSPGHESKRRKINKNKEPESNQAKPKKSAEIPDAKLKKPKSKQAAGKSKMKTSVKENEGEASAVAALFATFGPGSCLPTKADLLKIYSKFGALNEAETDMFYNSFCARIAFIRRSDAEEALNQSLQSNPFKSAYVTFRLLYPKPGSKTREIREIPPPNTVSVPSVQGKTQEKSSDSQPLQLDYLKQKLEMMNSMLENSGGKVSPDTKGKLESEIKGLLEKLSTEPGSSSS